MIRFLRLFSAYRHVESALERQNAHAKAVMDALQETKLDKLRIQDRSLWLESELNRTREQLDRANTEKDAALKQVGNLGWQFKAGYRPFPEAAGLPEEWMPKNEGPVVPDHLLGQDSVRRENVSVLTEWQNRVSKAKKNA